MAKEFGHFYRPPADLTVTLAESDTEFDRIDLIEVKCNYVTNKVYVDVIMGEPLGTPTIPHLQRDVSAYCLGLAAVTVKANTAEVTQADIKDLRFDTNYCGVVVGKISTISTTDLFAQYQRTWDDFISKLGKDDHITLDTADHKARADIMTVKTQLPFGVTGLFKI